MKSSGAVLTSRRAVSLDEFMERILAQAELFRAQCLADFAADPRVHPLQATGAAWEERFGAWKAAACAIEPDQTTALESCVAGGEDRVPERKSKGIAPKPLQLISGEAGAIARLIGARPFRGARAYIAAHSRADAMRMIVDLLGDEPSGMRHEIAKNWASVWGNAMKGVPPERGIWVAQDAFKPAVRVYTPPGPSSAAA